MPTLFNCKQLFENLKFSYNVTYILLKCPYLVKDFATNSNGKGSKDPENKNDSPVPGTKLTEKKESSGPPEEPTTCCMSGCPNCVWVEYAEALCKYYKDGGEQAIREINEKISDQNMRAFLLHELRMRKIK